MPIVYIGAGSNQGDRYENIDRSRRLLEEQGAHVRRVSPLYENPAVCRPGETAPDYLNGVFEVETGLAPEALLDLLESVERSLGRVQKGDWSPRSIDLDLLLYDDREIETEKLTVPHPRMHERWFVLKPLADLAPDVVHPVIGRTIRELLIGTSP